MFQVGRTSTQQTQLFSLASRRKRGSYHWRREWVRPCLMANDISNDSLNRLHRCGQLQPVDVCRPAGRPDVIGHQHQQRQRATAADDIISSHSQYKLTSRMCVWWTCKHATQATYWSIVVRQHWALSGHSHSVSHFTGLGSGLSRVRVRVSSQGYVRVSVG